jgi:hypothetical protein
MYLNRTYNKKLSFQKNKNPNFCVVYSGINWCNFAHCYV